MIWQSHDTSVVLSAEEYLSRYRDVERFIAFCRDCHRYGNCWACPPFGFDTDSYLSGYRSVLLIGTKIIPDKTLCDCRDKERCREIGREMLSRERTRLDRRLLELEQNHPGSRACYAGTCHLCTEEECSRRRGLPCRYPEQIRPSLEALGFDIGRTASELLHIELQWSTDGLLPPYFTLVSGLFTDRESNEIRWERV